MSDVVFRPYTPSDLSRCLAIFDGNVPTFFDIDERDDFRAFLQGADRGEAPYLVAELEGSVVASGGLAVASDGTCARLAWGMVDRTRHGEGLGTRLTEARLALARADPRIVELRLDTSRRTTGFYERFGFTVSRIVPDGFAPGLDRHEMVSRLPAA